jgi:hypothetical protein
MQLRDRTDLVSFVAHDLTLPPVARRACLTGTVEVLGGFEDIPGSNAPGWILTCEAKHGTVHYIAILANGTRHSYRCRLVGSVPWHLWCGAALPGISYSIYRGDHPAVYDARRDAERQRRKLP